MDISQLNNKMDEFADERDWKQFHTPKNLTMALTGEVGELNELFQWKTDAEIVAMMQESNEREHVEDELSDVFFYVMRLSAILGVDIEKAFSRKMEKNRLKYPPELCRGKARKYTDYAK